MRNISTIVSTICIGVQILGNTLTTRSPSYFDGNMVKKDIDDNWILKVNNIKKITSNLGKLYQNELGLHDEVQIDEKLIGKEQNEAEIFKLIQLVMGVLVECENKVEFLGNIMSMEHETQMELMLIIERVCILHFISCTRTSGLLVL
jgi:protein HOOK3